MEDKNIQENIHKKILYLEDNENDFLLASAILEEEGIESAIQWVDNRAQFEEAVTRGGFDVILVDYNIPGYDGLTALTFVREKGLDVPVIILSGNLGEELAIDMLKHGATDYVLKQRISRLVPSIRRAMEENEEKKKRKEAETALKENEKKYREQLMQADKMASLGILVSGVAHEINNPNNAIMFNAPLLREIFDDAWPIFEKHYAETGELQLGGFSYEMLKESVDDLLEGIRLSSGQIKRIVADLKDYARPTLFGMDQPVDVNRVVRAALNLLKNMVKKATHRFSAHYNPDVPLVRGNVQRLEQVVVNLVQNACQALKSRQDAVTVTISCDEACGQVFIEVKDEGEGIPPDKIKFITDPFYTTRRDVGGTGLGLSVSSRIVKDHGGRLDVESTPGKGSTFTLVLPAVIPGEPGPAEPGKEALTLPCSEESQETGGQ